jgi:hypothetical protein
LTKSHHFDVIDWKNLNVFWILIFWISDYLTWVFGIYASLSCPSMHLSRDLKRNVLQSINQTLKPKFYQTLTTKFKLQKRRQADFMTTKIWNWSSLSYYTFSAVWRMRQRFFLINKNIISFYILKIPHILTLNDL